MIFLPKNPLAVVTAQSPKPIQLTINLLTKDQSTSTENSFTPNLISPITKSLTESLPEPINLPLQNPNQNLISKTLPVTNMVRKAIFIFEGYGKVWIAVKRYWTIAEARLNET